MSVGKVTNPLVNVPDEATATRQEVLGRVTLLSAFVNVSKLVPWQGQFFESDRCSHVWFLSVAVLRSRTMSSTPV
jgi:hypothetical protein